MPLYEPNPQPKKLLFWKTFKKYYKLKVGIEYTKSDIDNFCLKHIRDKLISQDLDTLLKKFFSLKLEDYSFKYFYLIMKYDILDYCSVCDNIRELTLGDLYTLRKIKSKYEPESLKKLLLTKKHLSLKEILNYCEPTNTEEMNDVFKEFAWLRLELFKITKNRKYLANPPLNKIEQVYKEYRETYNSLQKKS